MKNKTKIFAVFCMIAVLALTMCVSAFADEVAPGDIVRLTIDTGGAPGYADSISISPSNNIRVIYSENGSVIFDDVAYKVDVMESAGYLSVVIYRSVDDYNDMLPSVNYISSQAGVAVFDFYGLTSYQIGNEDGIIMETISTNRAVNSITGVFGAMTSFIIGGIDLFQPVFYVNGGLTLLGSLAVIALAVGVAFLIIGVIQKFLALRG